MYAKGNHYATKATHYYHELKMRLRPNGEHYLEIIIKLLFAKRITRFIDDQNTKNLKGQLQNYNWSLIVTTVKIANFASGVPS